MRSNTNIWPAIELAQAPVFEPVVIASVEFTSGWERIVNVNVYSVRCDLSRAIWTTSNILNGCMHVRLLELLPFRTEAQVSLLKFVRCLCAPGCRGTLLRS